MISLELHQLSVFQRVPAAYATDLCYQFRLADAGFGRDLHRQFRSQSVRARGTLGWATDAVRETCMGDIKIATKSG